MSDWLKHPWSDRVDWPDPLRLLRGILGADRASFVPGLLLLLPREGALPVVGHVNKVAAKDIIDSPEGCALTWMRIYTHGRAPELALVPTGAALCYVDPRCLSPEFLARPLPARWNHLGSHAYAELAPTLTGLPNGELVLENEPPPLPPSAAAPTGPVAPGAKKPEVKAEKDDGQLGLF